MKLRRTTPSPAPTSSGVPTTGTYLELSTIERLVVGSRLRLPSDAVVVRETSRALDMMSSGGGTFATLECERVNGALRIKGGRDALDVARAIRSRAMRRGDHNWAAELGTRLRFRLVEAEATPSPSPRSSKRGHARTAARIASRIAFS